MQAIGTEVLPLCSEGILSGAEKVDSQHHYSLIVISISKPLILAQNTRLQALATQQCVPIICVPSDGFDELRCWLAELDRQFDQSGWFSDFTPPELPLSLFLPDVDTVAVSDAARFCGLRFVTALRMTVQAFWQNKELAGSDLHALALALKNWISQFVLLDAEAPQLVKARYPLCAADIQVLSSDMLQLDISLSFDFVEPVAMTFRIPAFPEGNINESD